MSMEIRAINTSAISIIYSLLSSSAVSVQLSYNGSLVPLVAGILAIPHAHIVSGGCMDVDEAMVPTRVGLWTYIL
jgi:hypothetical protein